MSTKIENIEDVKAWMLEVHKAFTGHGFTVEPVREIARWAALGRDFERRCTEEMGL